jgi:hypothetical protein
MKMLEAESKRRGGKLTREAFAASIGLKPQTISSMRQALSMESLAEAMKVYPHWNFRYLVSGMGDPIPEAPAGDESIKRLEMISEWLRGVNIKLENEKASLEKERSDLKKENEALLRDLAEMKGMVRVLEQQVSEVTPGVRRGASRAG